MWGGIYNNASLVCDWSGGQAGAGEFDECPDLQFYSDGEDCDPACTLTGGYKESKLDTCHWHNINDGGTPGSY